MKNIFFLNPIFKIIGTILMLLSLTIIIFFSSQGVYTISGIFIPEKWVFVLMLISLMFIIFSREKNDSERIYEIKQRAVFLAILINLVCSIVFIACLSSIADRMWVFYYGFFSVYFFYIIIFCIGKWSKAKASVSE